MITAPTVKIQPSVHVRGFGRPGLPGGTQQRIQRGQTQSPGYHSRECMIDMLYSVADKLSRTTTHSNGNVAEPS